jgi:hypothetical protein
MTAGVAMIGSTISAGASSGARASAGAESTGEKSMSNNREQGLLPKGLVGFQLAYEQFPVNELVELGVFVEQAGFDVITNSDHLQPWQSNDAHSGQAWLTMAAIGARTKKICMGTTVTCPTLR